MSTPFCTIKWQQNQQHAVPCVYQLSRHLPLQRMSPEYVRALGKADVTREFIRRYVFRPNRCATTCKLKEKKKKQPNRKPCLRRTFVFLLRGRNYFQPFETAHRLPRRGFPRTTESNLLQELQKAQRRIAFHQTKQRNKENIFRLEFSSNVSP